MMKRVPAIPALTIVGLLGAVLAVTRSRVFRFLDCPSHDEWIFSGIGCSCGGFVVK